jgi:hypothetical protein
VSIAMLSALSGLAALSGAGLPGAVALADDKAPAAKGSSSVSTLIGRAQDMFDDARYEESIQTLSGALVRPGTSTDDRVKVLKLLAYNYITIGKNEEADAAVRALYVLDDTFELGSTESPRFRDFFKKTRSAWESEGKPGKEAAAKATAEAPIRIVHSPPSQVKKGEVVKIEGKIEDEAGRVQKVELSVKNGPKGKFSTKPLIYSMGAFRGQIAGVSVAPPLVEYYILALDKDGLPLASRGDVDAPLRIAVPEEGKSVLASPWFWIPIGATVVAGGILTGVLVSRSGSAASTSHVKIVVAE